MLRSYKKALDTGDYETAQNLDTRHIAPRDLALVHREVFAHRIESAVKAMRIEGVITNLEKARTILKIDDETLRGELRAYLILRERNSVTRDNHNGYFCRSLGVCDRTGLQKLGKHFGVHLTPRETLAAWTEGFFRHLADRHTTTLPNLVSKKHVDALANAYGLSTRIEGSQRFTSMVLKQFGETLTKTSVSNQYFSGIIDEVSRMLHGEYFPKEAGNGRTLRTLVDTCFKRESRVCAAIANGTYMPVARDTKQYMEEKVPHYRNALERLFCYGEKLGVSDDAFRNKDFTGTVKRYLSDYFDSAPSKDGFSCFFSLAQLARLGFTKEELVTRAQTAYIKGLEGTNGCNVQILKQLREKFLLDGEFLNRDTTASAGLVYADRLVGKDDWNTLLTFLDMEPFGKEFQKTEDFLRFREQALLWAINPQQPSAAIMRSLVGKIGLPGDDEPCARALFDETIGKLIDGHLPAFKTFFQSNNFYDVTYCGEKYRSASESTQARMRPVQLFYEATRIAERTGHFGLLQKKVAEVANMVFTGQDSFGPLRELSRKSEEVSDVFSIATQTFHKITLDYLTKHMGMKHRQDSYTHDFIGSSVENLRWLQKEFGFTATEARMLAESAFTHYGKSPEAMNHERTLIAIANDFHLPNEATREGALALFERYLAADRTEDALRVNTQFALHADTSLFVKKSNERFMAALEAKDIVGMLRAVKHGVSEKILSSSETRDVVQSILTNTLRSSAHHIGVGAMDLLKTFLPDMTANEMLAIHPKRGEIVSLTKRYPEIGKKMFATPLDILENAHLAKKMIEAFKRHPFTAGAVAENPRYGLKLAAKIDRLDKLSRENIATLFAAKDSLWASGVRPDNAPEFRVAMQQKLMGYRRNAEIAGALLAKGVNIAHWLDHNQTLRFTLGGSKRERLSTTVSAPVVRIGKTVETYETELLSALLPFKKELTAATVSSARTEKLREGLAVLEAQLAKEGGAPNKRTLGMRKQVEKLHKEIAKQKPIPLWEKFTSEFGRMKLSYERVVQAHTKLAAAEVGNSKVSAACIELDREITALAQKIDTGSASSASLEELIAPVLGLDRTLAIINEVLTNTGEHRDHFMSDRETLARALSPKDGGTLEGRPMEVRVWSRDPDVDLYMGNYTNCCIRIDSDHMGSESTIADYCTDIGMQVVAVYDRTTDAPVAAAWCWIGHDDNDRLAFVVDNIEADTNYTAKHHGELTKTLKTFVADYAAAVGVPHVVQGTCNNDMTIANMDSAYFKVGGYNRASGYFLEGEENGQNPDDNGGGNWDENGDANDDEAENDDNGTEDDEFVEVEHEH